MKTRSNIIAPVPIASNEERSTGGSATKSPLYKTKPPLYKRIEKSRSQSRAQRKARRLQRGKKS